MTTPLRKLLGQFRESSRMEREKGNYFERLAVAFLKHDPGIVQEYEDSWMLSDWAKLHGASAADIGVDAVAKIRGEDGFCAIQCKFYADGRSIPKGEVDKFLAACKSKHFSRGLIITTNGGDFSGKPPAMGGLHLLSRISRLGTVQEHAGPSACNQGLIPMQAPFAPKRGT